MFIQDPLPDGYVDLAAERRCLYYVEATEEPPPIHSGYVLEDLYSLFVARKSESHSACLQSVVVQDASLLSLRVSNVGYNALFGPLVEEERSQKVEQRKQQIQRAIQGPGIGLLADTIEAVLPYCTPGAVWMFAHRPDVSSVPTFLVDPDSRLCFIHGPIIARGTYKNVRRVFAVPFEKDNPISQVVSKTNCIAREEGLSKVQESEEIFQGFVGEILDTNGSPVFPRQYLSIQYLKAVEDGIVLNRVEVAEEGLNDSSDIQISFLPENMQIQFLHQVLAHLATIYPKIHGDLKPANILYMQTPGGDITVKFTDWGFRCIPKEGDRTFIMDCGMYGAIEHTAPEVLGQDPKSVDWYKAESWALGCCLYRWLYGRDVPWSSFVQTIYNGVKLGYNPPRSEIERLYENVRAVIEAKKDELARTYAPFREKIAQVCFDLLECDVLKRKTAQEMLESLGRRGLRLHQRPQK